MNLNKIFFYIFSGTLILISFTFLSQIFIQFESDNQSYALPQKKVSKNPVSRCYDSFYGDPKEILSVQDGQYTYYQIVAQPKESNLKDEIDFLYFRTTIYRCENLSRDISGTGRLAFMPKSVAVKFADQWYKPALDKCFKSKSDQKTAKQLCIKEFESQINVPANTKEASPQFLFTEDAIALKKLGIRTDKALVVDTYADFEKYMSKIRKPSSQSKK